VQNTSHQAQIDQTMLTGGDFARNRRIVKTDEFSSVFRFRPVQRTEHFVLYANPNNLDNARLGVVAAKRFAPRAATRNMIKRVTREMFRQLKLVNVDCIVRLSKPVNKKADSATNAQIKRDLRVEVRKLFASQLSVSPSNTSVTADASSINITEKAKL
jgi:ribonuclease P protein component